MIQKSKSLVIVAISCLICTGFLFQSCEKESILPEKFDLNEFLSIEGEVDDPETMMDLSKLETLRKANSRVFENAKIEKGVLSLKANSGEDLNMSKALFLYGIKNIDNINNQIVAGKIKPYVDKNGKLRIRSTKISTLNGLARLKSGQVESGSTKYNPSKNSHNDNLNWINNLYNSNPDGDLSSYMDVGNTNWQSNSMGMYSVSGYGTLNGKNARYMILNNCGGWVDPINCGANYIGNTTNHHYSQGSVSELRIIRNANGDPVATITIYR